MNRVVSSWIMQSFLFGLVEGCASLPFQTRFESNREYHESNEHSIRFIRSEPVPDVSETDIRRLLFGQAPKSAWPTNMLYYTFAVSNLSEKTDLFIDIHRPFLPGLFADVYIKDNSGWVCCELPPFPEFSDGPPSREEIRFWLDGEDDWAADNSVSVPERLIELLLNPDMSFMADYYATGGRTLAVKPNEERTFSILFMPLSVPFSFCFRGHRENKGDSDRPEASPAGEEPVSVFSPVLLDSCPIGQLGPNEQRSVLSSKRSGYLWQYFHLDPARIFNLPACRSISAEGNSKTGRIRDLP